MKLTIRLVIATALLSGSAHAQTVIFNGNNGNIVRPVPVEAHKTTISVNLQFSVPAASGPASADMTSSMSSASSQLYAIINRECQVLVASIPGECRLVQLNIGGNIGNRQPQFNSQLTVMASANATFELDPSVPSPAASPPASHH